MLETENREGKGNRVEPNSTQPSFQFGLKELLLLPVFVAVFLGITVGFGQFAVMALPFAFLAFSVIWVVALLLPRRTTFVEALVVAAVVYLVASLFASGCVDPRGPTRESECRNTLKCIGLALHQYHEVYGCFPPAYVADERGRPIHSWRVLILPFLEEQALYEQYDFDEPWDGPNNRRLTRAQVDVYRCPEEDGSARTTSYVAVVGEGTVWPGEGSVEFSDVTDEASKTLMVVEIANSGIHWMAPNDLDFSAATRGVNAEDGASISSLHPRDKWGRPASQTANVLLIDGSVHILTRQTSPEDLDALLTIDGGEKIDPAKLGW